MKWVVFALMAFAAFASPPWLRRAPRRIGYVAFLIGFSPLYLGLFHTNMAIISWAAWPGYVKGIEVSIIDFLVVATFLSLPRARHAPPFALPMVAYFVAVLLSVLQADVAMASVFYCWQLLKLYFVYRVLSRACESPEFVDALLKGLGSAVIIQAFLAGWQHFALGITQAAGTQASQNELGMLTNLVAIPIFAILVSERSGRLPGSVVASAVVITISTGSRATVGLGGLGYATTLILSLMRRWTRRKALILMAGVGVAIVGGVAASAALSHRGAAEMESSDQERITFERAAGMMLADHPFGVGANQYVVVANTQHYNERAGVLAVSGSEGANVHNVYRLVAAETGYLGLATYLVLLASCLAYVFRGAWRYRGDQRGDLLLGIGVSFCILYVHSLYEWVFITFQVQYVYCILLALAVGVTNQLKYSPRLRNGPGRSSSRSASVARARGVGAPELVRRELWR